MSDKNGDQNGDQTGGQELSKETVGMIQSEINRCVENCNHHVLFRGFIPSRLLFVGDSDSDSPPQPRLVSRGEVMASLNWASSSATSAGDVLRYAALSYCWGPPADARRQCKTERQSLAAHSTNGVNALSMSAVVRDAVVVVRQLGLRYLWVDCLCIVQDDERDWRDEAALMGLVYSNAFVTIVSLASDTCLKGFLAPWAATSQIWRTVRVPVENSTLTEGSEGDICFQYSYEFLRDWERSAWSKRGWTFQETKLSTRLVYFGPSRIHFCCDSWLYTSGRSTRGTFERSIIDLAVDKETADPASELLNFWRWALVPQYSTKRFTVARDKLPAIGGIAKLVGDITGFGYAAGLWTPHLHVDLAWHSPPQPVHLSLESLIQSLRPSDEDFIAPSWSWARFPTTECAWFWIGNLAGENVVAEVKGLRAEVDLIETVSSNPYGQIRGGVVRMEARTLDILQGESCSQRPYSAVGQNLFFADWDVEGGGEEEGKCADNDVELALIGSYTATFERAQETEERRYYGLMIYSAGSPGRYFRVGIFDVPEESEYGVEFKSAEWREIELL